MHIYIKYIKKQENRYGNFVPTNFIAIFQTVELIERIFIAPNKIKSS